MADDNVNLGSLDGIRDLFSQNNNTNASGNSLGQNSLQTIPQQVAPTVQRTQNGTANGIGDNLGSVAGTSLDSNAVSNNTQTNPYQWNSISNAFQTNNQQPQGPLAAAQASIRPNFNTNPAQSQQNQVAYNNHVKLFGVPPVNQNDTTNNSANGSANQQQPNPNQSWNDFINQQAQANNAKANDPFQVHRDYLNQQNTNLQQQIKNYVDQIATYGNDPITSQKYGTTNFYDPAKVAAAQEALKLLTGQQKDLSDQMGSLDKLQLENQMQKSKIADDPVKQLENLKAQQALQLGNLINKRVSMAANDPELANTDKHISLLQSFISGKTANDNGENKVIQEPIYNPDTGARIGTKNSLFNSKTGTLTDINGNQSATPANPSLEFAQNFFNTHPNDPKALEILRAAQAKK